PAAAPRQFGLRAALLDAEGTAALRLLVEQVVDRARPLAAPVGLLQQQPEALCALRGAAVELEVQGAAEEVAVRVAGEAADPFFGVVAHAVGDALVAPLVHLDDDVAF